MKTNTKSLQIPTTEPIFTFGIFVVIKVEILYPLSFVKYLFSALAYCICTASWVNTQIYERGPSNKEQ